jgi:hypothetical protein
MVRTKVSSKSEAKEAALTMVLNKLSEKKLALLLVQLIFTALTLKNRPARKNQQLKTVRTKTFYVATTCS